MSGNGGNQASLAGFASFAFGEPDAKRIVYRRGSGPGVVVIHEVLGITPEVARFARRVADAGFETLHRELGSGFEAIEIDSGRGNPDCIPRTAHSVVTLDLVDEAGHPTREALDRVLCFFAERLRSA